MCNAFPDCLISQYVRSFPQHVEHCSNISLLSSYTFIYVLVLSLVDYPNVCTCSVLSLWLSCLLLPSCFCISLYFLDLTLHIAVFPFSNHKLSLFNVAFLCSDPPQWTMIHRLPPNKHIKHTQRASCHMILYNTHFQIELKQWLNTVVIYIFFPLTI